MKYTPVKHSGNSHTFKIKVSSNEKIHLHTLSDVHFDNPKCNRQLLFKHLDEALGKNALIAITGDFFCLMQGRYDPRGTKSDVRPEHNKNNYLDLVINDTAEQFAKYAKNIILISHGNHESKVSLRCETAILDRFVERLNYISGSSVQVGAYAGYYTLGFQYKKGRTYYPLNVGYSHGNWGGIITKGTLSVVRMAAIMPEADIIFSGHTHDGWIVPQPRLVRSPSARQVEIKNQWHIKTGTYKEEFAKGEGWATERIGMPKYLGSCFTEIEFNKHSGLQYRFSLTY